MGLSKPIDEIFSFLEEIERYKAELLSGANPLLQSQQHCKVNFNPNDTKWK